VKIAADTWSILSTPSARKGTKRENRAYDEKKEKNNFHPRVFREKSRLGGEINRILSAWR